MFHFLNVRKRDTWDTLRGWQVDSTPDDEDGTGWPNYIIVGPIRLCSSNTLPLNTSFLSIMIHYFNITFKLDI